MCENMVYGRLFDGAIKMENRIAICVPKSLYLIFHDEMGFQRTEFVENKTLQNVSKTLELFVQACQFNKVVEVVLTRGWSGVIVCAHVNTSPYYLLLSWL